jgi:hypothetical protein
VIQPQNQPHSLCLGGRLSPAANGPLGVAHLDVTNTNYPAVAGLRELGHGTGNRRNSPLVPIIGLVVGPNHGHGLGLGVLRNGFGGLTTGRPGVLRTNGVLIGVRLGAEAALGMLGGGMDRK